MTSPVEQNFQASLVKKAAYPLYTGRGWLKFIGIISLISGIFTALSIIGIIIAWVPIWQGVLLLQVSNAIQKSFEMNDESFLIQAQSKLKIYFTLLGVLLILGFILFILSAILGFLGILTGLSHYESMFG